MKFLRHVLFCTLAIALASGARAFEFENAVPLAIGGKLTNLPFSDLSVRLEGNVVSISGLLTNTADMPAYYGFYANTPLFQQIGEGEEHFDKSFRDLSVSVNGNAIPVISGRYGFYLGRDITSTLVAAGLDPLPNESDDPKRIASISGPIRPSDGRGWEGLATYSWGVTVGAGSSKTLEARYKALPQFGLEDVTGVRFSRLVRQHCGDVERVTDRIRKMRPGASAVVMEKYVIPVSVANRNAYRLTVTQPQVDALGAHPLFALACGLSDGGDLPVSGMIADPDDVLSVLVIAAPAAP